LQSGTAPITGPAGEVQEWKVSVPASLLGGSAQLRWGLLAQTVAGGSPTTYWDVVPDALAGGATSPDDRRCGEGHVTPASTYYYLTSAPDLLALAARRLKPPTERTPDDQPGTDA